MHSKQILRYSCILLLLAFTSACGGQSNSTSKTTKAQTSVSKASTTSLLKFTTGIRAIFEDSQGNTWFGSHAEGVAVLKANHNAFGFTSNEFTYYDEKDGLSNRQIRAIYEDKNGAIWFETGNGLSNYDGKTITKRTDRNYQAKNQWQLNDHDLWFKSDEMSSYNEQEGHPGVYQYDGQQLTYRAFPIKLKIGQENYYSITTPFVKGKNGMVWFGTYGAAIGYNGSKFIIIDNAYTGRTKENGFLHIRGLMEDSKGHLWIANNGIGMLKYDGEKIIDFTAQHKLRKGDTKGNTLHRVFSVGEDNQGNIWFGTYKSGVWRYDGQTLKNFTAKDGLYSEHIWTIYKSKNGEMWFGGASPSGVYKFNGTAFERKY
ncbi:hypothetical protein BKI52_11250 [marine bacterium AO1-C]|nr:hypothetical protein BKI52_11250 [marine bacterium AO1-C]